MVNEYLKELSFDLHNATADVTALIELMKKVGVTKSDLQSHSFSVDFVLAMVKYRRDLNRCLLTLNGMVPRIVSKTMASKMAGSGLTLQHLKLAYRRGKEAGVENILKEKFHGKPRVTAEKKILGRIASYISSLA